MQENEAIDFKKIIIRKMNITDLDSISPILSSDFDDFWSYNVFKQELANENSKYICAIYNNEIIGFAGIWICIDEAHITNIVTKKDFRNKGIGSLLLKNLISISSSLNSITLEVNEKNETAISLYKNFDFKLCGKRKKYYNGKDAALIMTRNF